MLAPASSCGLVLPEVLATPGISAISMATCVGGNSGDIDRMRVGKTERIKKDLIALGCGQLCGKSCSSN